MLPVLSDQERIARGAIPEAVYDYYAGGSGDELTLSANVRAWRSYALRPRVLSDVVQVDPSMALLGTALRSPVIVAPSALHGLVHSHAEVETARGVVDAGTLMVLSTRSSSPLEDVARAVAGPWWFQVYVMRNRDLTAQLVTRAAANGATALMLTGDTPYVGMKKRPSEGLVIGDMHLANLAAHMASGSLARSDTEQDPSITVDVIAWLRELSGLPVIVKGVLRADDARACVDAGAAGVVVSNHGGRQLDRAVATARALPEVAVAVGTETVVLVDGGVRSGLDVLTALALGADAVMLGRPILWALAAHGRAGVAACLDAMRADLCHVMALCGASDLRGISRDLVAS